jgi:diguanylate cyclase (GGDEF)-like protein
MNSADEVLIETALRLRDAFGIRLLARYGGDEFVGILRGPISEPNAGAVAERIVEAFRVPFRIVVPDMSIDVIQSVSLGVVLWNSPFAQFEALLKDADLALLDAKRQGGGRYVINAGNATSSIIS